VDKRTECAANQNNHDWQRDERRGFSANAMLPSEVRKQAEEGREGKLDASDAMLSVYRAGEIQTYTQQEREGGLLEGRRLSHFSMG